MFIAALLTNNLSRDGWMDKEDETYTIEYYMAMRKKAILPFVITWIDLEGIMLKKCQTEQNKYCTVSLIYRI